MQTDSWIVSNHPIDTYQLSSSCQIEGAIRIIFHRVVIFERSTHIVLLRARASDQPKQHQNNTRHNTHAGDNRATINPPSLYITLPVLGEVHAREPAARTKTFPNRIRRTFFTPNFGSCSYRCGQSPQQIHK